MNDQLLAAFGEFSDAAYAMGHCQLAQATEASDRLERTRSGFYDLFMQGVKDEAALTRSRAGAITLPLQFKPAVLPEF